jgi:hypothetical protein
LWIDWAPENARAQKCIVNWRREAVPAPSGTEAGDRRLARAPKSPAMAMAMPLSPRPPPKKCGAGCGKTTTSN